ncbi:MAG: integrase core domain-containing protein [Candidatus Nanoarchaeia archaeon]
MVIHGKVERFFRTYKEEFIQETFIAIKHYINHYNKQRPHMSLSYKTPLMVWNELRNV